VDIVSYLSEVHTLFNPVFLLNKTDWHFWTCFWPCILTLFLTFLTLYVVLVCWPCMLTLYMLTLYLE
jgi:hypothetical protein